MENKTIVFNTYPAFHHDQNFHMVLINILYIINYFPRHSIYLCSVIFPKNILFSNKWMRLGSRQILFDIPVSPLSLSLSPWLIILPVTNLHFNQKHVTWKQLKKWQLIHSSFFKQNFHWKLRLNFAIYHCRIYVAWDMYK